MATKPSLGYEQQLFISTGKYTDLGVFNIVNLNSGVATMSVPAAAQLSTVPQELMAVLESEVVATGALVITVSGLDSSNAPVSYVATFQPPGYAKDQSYVFSPRMAFELIPQAAALNCKTITNIAVTCDAGWVNANIRILGVPSLASFVKIGTKVKLDLDPKVPMPVAVQDGRDRGAFIKSGEIDVGTCNITVKDPTSADGLWRYKGNRVTGLIKEIKEDILPTQYMFLCGLIITPKTNVPEGAEAITLEGTGMYEKFAAIPAH